MQRLGAVTVAVFAMLLLLAADAQAQSAARGKQLYESRINPNSLSCSDAAACHGPDPLANTNKIRNGTNPQAILAALNTVAVMATLRGLVSATDAADIAAYITNPNAATPGPLVVSAAFLAFGSTAAGATNANSNPAFSTITNNSAAAVSITAIGKAGANAAEFAATGTCVSATPVQLAPGASCTLGATFTPAATGTRLATLTVQSSASASLSIGLSGMASATAAATVALSRTAIAFPTQTIATTSAAQDVAVRNSGTAALTITQVATAPMPEFTASSSCVGTIVPGGGCTIVVVFTPSAAGQRAGGVTITSNTGSTTVALSGNSVLTPTGIATAGATSLALPSVQVGASPSSNSLQFANSGNAPLQISGITIQGPDARDFALSGANTCRTGAMAPLAECRLDVEFRPQSAGSKSASVALTHDGTSSSSVIAVTATATAAPTPAPPAAQSKDGGGGSMSLAALLALFALGVVTTRARVGGR